MEPDIANAKISMFDDENGDLPGFLVCTRPERKCICNIHICNWVLHIQLKLQGLKILGEAGKQEILQQMFRKF